MEKAYGNFMVYIENDVEQKELMNILAARGFHWMSGHIANDIPVLLRLRPESKGQILSIDIKKKTIRFVPTEGMTQQRIHSGRYYQDFKERNKSLESDRGWR